VKLPSQFLAWTAAATVLALAASFVALRAEPESQREVVALESLYSEPATHLGRSFRVRFQVRGECAEWNPYLTRFGAAEYRAFDVWSDSQFLWDKEQWDAPLGRCFVRRGGIAERTLEGAPRLSRIEAIVTVRQVFLGRPWFEVESARRIVDELGESTLLHASRGYEAFLEGRWTAARERFDQALVGSMPEALRTELRRLRESTLQPHSNDTRREQR
jgi:hypothetical protein